MVKSRRRIGRSKISSGASSLKIRRKKSNRTKKLNKRARKPKRTKKRNLKKQKVYSGRERPLYHKLNRPERLLVHMEGGAVRERVPEVVKEVMWHGDYPGIRQLENIEDLKKNQIDDPVPPLPQPVVPDEQARLARQDYHERLMEEADRVIALGRAARAEVEPEQVMAEAEPEQVRAEADEGFDPGAPSPEPEQVRAEVEPRVELAQFQAAHQARVEQAMAELARAQQARDDLRRVRAEQARAENQARVDHAARLNRTNMELELARVALKDAMTTRQRQRARARVLEALAAQREERRQLLPELLPGEQMRDYFTGFGTPSGRIHDV